MLLPKIRITWAVMVALLLVVQLSQPSVTATERTLVMSDDPREPKDRFVIRKLHGWVVHIRPELLTSDAKATERALELLGKQLQEIIDVVPKPVVTKLRKVPLYFSPEYPGKRPAAEFHPGVGWLRKNGRDPIMAKGVEFTNIRIFEAETRRMPNFALHELAHAYHDIVLPNGFGNPEIISAYQKAKNSGKYERVQRRDSEGRTRMDRAYAMTTPMEYFAETTEAYFSRNDFFPFTSEELKKHDPEMFALLTKLWRVESPPKAEPPPRNQP